MPAKITKEVRERIYDLKKDGKSVKEILGILRAEGIKISDKSIYRILKEKRNNDQWRHSKNHLMNHLGMT